MYIQSQVPYCWSKTAATLQFPAANDEAADPLCRRHLRGICDLLRDRTRDARKFPLVFEELTNYGFRAISGLEVFRGRTIGNGVIALGGSWSWH